MQREKSGEYARVELYNLCRSGRAVGSGFQVARFTADHRRMNTLEQFAGDETAARVYVEKWNGLESR